MPQDDALRLTIGDETYELDDLELGELEQLEDACGKPIAEIDLESAKAVTMLVWFAIRRRDPSFTLEQARQIKSSDLRETPAASKKGKGRPTRAAKAA